MVEVEVGFGLMVFGEDAFADDASIGRRTFCDENDNLTKLLIGTFTDDKWCRHVRTQLTLELFCLNFQPTRADDIVLSPEDTEFLTTGTVPIVRNLSYIVGDEGF